MFRVSLFRIKHATLQDGPDPMLELQAGLNFLQVWLMRLVHWSVRTHARSWKNNLRTFTSQCSWYVLNTYVVKRANRAWVHLQVFQRMVDMFHQVTEFLRCLQCAIGRGSGWGPFKKTSHLTRLRKRWPDFWTKMKSSRARMFKSQSSHSLLCFVLMPGIDEESFFWAGGNVWRFNSLQRVVQHNRRQHCSVLSSIDERKISPMMPQRSSCIPSAGGLSVDPIESLFFFQLWDWETRKLVS